MRLEQLDAHFLKRIDATHLNHVDSLSEADGVQFLCPKCFQQNNGPVGTHSVICWSPSVPQDTRPTPGRWSLSGSGLHDLTLTAASSSVLLNGGCAAHFFVQNGEIVGLS